jgi:hypothetical protein
MGCLENSALALVARSTLDDAYVGTWNAFGLWHGPLFRPRQPLQADDLMVSLFLQSLMDSDFLNTNYKIMTHILLRISFIFCGFNGRHVAKNPHETKTTIKYDQYMRYVLFRFGDILGLSIQEFQSQ